MMYQGTSLTIEPGDGANWWVDSSYAVHPDMHSHSSIIMTLGKGAHIQHHANKKSIQKIQQKQKWWPSMMLWVRYCGPGIS